MSYLYNTTAAVTSSLQLLINLIVSDYFQDARSITHLHNNSDLIPIQNAIPQVLNPSKCFENSYHFVLEDPVSSRLSHHLMICSRRKLHYKFRGIILLTKDKIENYRTMQSAFAINSIFIQKEEGYLIISSFLNWELTKHGIVNRWNMVENRFEEPVIEIEDFFDERKFIKNNDYEFKFNSFITVPLFMYDQEEQYATGTDYNMVVEFMKTLNVKVKIVTDGYGSMSVGYMYGDNGGVQNYPTSFGKLKFFVPKPIIYINWLQLFKVFPLGLWLLVFFAMISGGFYFRIASQQQNTDNYPGVLSTIGLFLLQGITNHQMPQRLRGRIVLALLLILVVIYSAVFGSGVVGKMITASYQNDISNMEDLASSNLPICFWFNPKTLYTDDTLTDAERIAYSRYYGLENLFKFRAWERVLPNFETMTGLSSLLHVMRNDIQYVKVMDPDSSIQLSSTMYTDDRMLFVIPKMDLFGLRCKAVGLFGKWEMDAYRMVNPYFRILEMLDQSMPKTNVRNLSFDHVKGAFIILACGTFFACLVFLFEVIRSFSQRVIQNF